MKKINQDTNKKEYKSFERQAKVLMVDLECFVGSTEVLTQDGFVRFDKLKDEKVAQYHEDGTITFVKPTRKIKKHYNGNVVDFKTSMGTITATENHTMVARSVRSGKIFTYLAKESPNTGITMFAGQNKRTKKLSALDRLAIALQADAYRVNEGVRRFDKSGEPLAYWTMTFRKSRKIERMERILTQTDLRWRKTIHHRKTGQLDTIFSVYTPIQMTKSLDTWFKVSECGEDFIEEIALWDGSIKTYNSGYRQISYSCGQLDNIEFVRDVAVMNNKMATYCRNGSGYKVTIGKTNTGDIRSFKKSVRKIDETVYCVEVPTHMIIVKGGQKVLVTGNCSPTLGYSYGQWQTNVIKVERPPVLLSFAWKWLGEKETHCLTLHDRATVQQGDDSLLVKELWNLIDECEVFVAHNVKFDQKMANAFFLRHGLTPASWYKTFCTLQTARRYFKLDNNKLDYLGQLLGVGQKTAITNHDVWYDCLIHNDEKAWKKLALYNIQDVDLLEKIYKKLLPFATNHPNGALSAGREDICPRCMHQSEFSIKAYRKTGTQINAIQLQCRNCHGYVTRPLTKEEREELDYHGRLKSFYRNIAN